MPAFIDTFTELTHAFFRFTYLLSQAAAEPGSIVNHEHTHIIEDFCTTGGRKELRAVSRIQHEDSLDGF